MWLLHFLPDSFLQFVVHAILLAGVIGCIVSFFALKYVPFITGYKKMAQVVSIVLLVSGIYFEGGYSNEMQWRQRVREMEAKVAKAEEESKAANLALDKKSAEKVKVIQGRQVVIKQYIDREVAKYNDQCVIPKPFIDAHNQSAEQPK
jgi:DNA-binding protein YbaB